MHIVFYDTETSHLSPYKGEIIQIAAIAFEIEGQDWEQVGQFECKLKFDMDKADPQALKVNCYDPVTWKTQAVDSHDALSVFKNWCGPYKDVQRVGKKSRKTFYNLRTGGHNVSGFDDAFIRAWFKKHDEFCPLDYSEVYDTLSLAKWLFQFWYPDYPLENHELKTLCNAYGVPLDGAHDALADVTANARLAWSMRYCKPLEV